jgi:hypothetical protein
VQILPELHACTDIESLSRDSPARRPRRNSRLRRRDCARLCRPPSGDVSPATATLADPENVHRQAAGRAQKVLRRVTIDDAARGTMGLAALSGDAAAAASPRSPMA